MVDSEGEAQPKREGEDSSEDDEDEEENAEKHKNKKGGSSSSVNSSLTTSQQFQPKHGPLSRILSRFDTICADCAVLKDDLGHECTAALIVELVRFLMLKALFRDIDASLLSPSSAVDAAWHALLLRPVLYSSVCHRLLSADVKAPRLLDHNPAGKACAQRHMRYRMTHARYLEVFREAPPEAYWPVEEMSSSSMGGDA